MRRRLLRCAAVALAIAAAIGALVALNGLVLAHRETPLLTVTAHPPRPLPRRDDGIELRVVSYNIAKAFAYRQRLRFKGAEVIRARLDDLAAVIRSVDPDLVFLSEALHECPPCEVSQVAYLAEQLGMHAWLFGECYNVGVPWYRVSGGNAILSRLPLAPDANLTLAGRRPFYVSRNNRRALFGTTRVGTQTVLLGALHNDSRANQNNTAQMRQILDFTAGRETLLAGDFNAWPDHASLALVRDSQRFTAVRGDQLTFPATRPNRTIDFIVAPASWELLEYRVLDSRASDHRPVFARLRCPSAVCGEP
ncbi:MAG: endonuclease/exonuclease/phosphatase family protein [Deltaproteobacteria bacterium]|nr:endonuclease/exonuclease/phosphatase family protein [Deltaproteobacteria bacterium]